MKKVLVIYGNQSLPEAINAFKDYNGEVMYMRDVLLDSFRSRRVDEIFVQPGLRLCQRQKDILHPLLAKPSNYNGWERFNG